MIKDKIIWVDCAVPIKDGYIKEIESKGYLLID